MDASKHILVFLGQSRNDNIIKLARDAKRCLEIIAAKVQMTEYESLSSVYGHSREILDDIFDCLQENLGESFEV